MELWHHAIEIGVGLDFLAICPGDAFVALLGV
jgi:hypothetical protein